MVRGRAKLKTQERGRAGELYAVKPPSDARLVCGASQGGAQSNRSRSPTALEYR